jgi:CO/xanthine dehydrogenase FAD-binding subunit
VTVATYLRPTSLPEALNLLAEHGPELLVIAGGTIAMPLINEGISLPREVMGLRHAGLDTYERGASEVRIGATLPLTRLAEQDDLPLLRAAARRTASWSIRNMATVGGNLFAPPPAGDVATALLALDARVTISGRDGERELPLADLWTGFLTTALAADELLTAIIVPLRDEPCAFLKFGRKEANTPAIVSVAVAGDRIALGAVDAHPIRAHRAEAAIAGRAGDEAALAAAAEAAADECEPLADALASEWYRRRMVRIFVERALREQAAGMNGQEA